MNIRFALVLIAALCGSLLAAPLAAQAEERVVGGITPDRRPEGLPTVKDGSLSAEARKKALHGVLEPYPPSLKWLDNQGGWFTPFSHPGMTGPYDIRKWHDRSNT